MDPSHAVSLRIVVDGPAGAGKTATARALGACLGSSLVTHGETGGSDGTFDFLEYVGGCHSGQPIRTQLITVPGDRWDHRAAMVRTADAVLFVVDSTERGLAGSAVAHRQLRDLLMPLPMPPGILVQANKRDAPDAVDLRAVRSVLGLDAAESIVETVAADGRGIRQAFVFAVRLGLSGVSDLGGKRPAEQQLAAAELVAHLTALEVPGDHPFESVPCGGTDQCPEVAPVPSDDGRPRRAGRRTAPRTPWWRRPWSAP